MNDPDVLAVLKQWTEADIALIRCITDVPMSSDDRMELAGEVLSHCSFHIRALSRAMATSKVMTPEQRQWFVQHAIEVFRNIGVPVQEVQAERAEEKSN